MCDHFITGRGAGAAADFGFAICTYLTGENESEKLRKSMCY